MLLFAQQEKKMKKICSIYHDLNHFFSLFSLAQSFCDILEPDFALKLFVGCLKIEVLIEIKI